MTCATCAVRVERVLGRQDGVEAANVNLANASALVRVGSGVKAADLESAVEKIGYRLTPRHHDSDDRDMVTHYHDDEAVQWRRFWWAAALTIPTVVLGMSWGDAL
jgi:cation transport ATPase